MEWECCSPWLVILCVVDQGCEGEMWWLGGRFVSATWDTAELIARGDTSI